MSLRQGHADWEQGTGGHHGKGLESSWARIKEGGQSETHSCRHQEPRGGCAGDPLSVSSGLLAWSISAWNMLMFLQGSVQGFSSDLTHSGGGSWQAANIYLPLLPGHSAGWHSSASFALGKTSGLSSSQSNISLSEASHFHAWARKPPTARPPSFSVSYGLKMAVTISLGPSQLCTQSICPGLLRWRRKLLSPYGSIC